jgi:hypothetical protein
VHRIDGCPQMWCTQCQTAFDYNTGKRIRGQVHNPHYAQWMQTQDGDARQNVENVECVDIMALASSAKVPFTDILMCRNIYNGYYDISQQVRSEGDYSRIRQKYLAGSSTEAQFESSIANKKSRHCYYLQVEALVEFFNAASKHMVAAKLRILSVQRRKLPRVSMVNKIDTIAPSLPTLRELSELTLFTNEKLEQLSKVYKLRRVKISTTLAIKFSKDE